MGGQGGSGFKTKFFFVQYCRPFTLGLTKVLFGSLSTLLKRRYFVKIFCAFEFLTDGWKKSINAMKQKKNRLVF